MNKKLTREKRILDVPQVFEHIAAQQNFDDVEPNFTLVPYFFHETARRTGHIVLFFLGHGLRWAAVRIVGSGFDLDKNKAFFVPSDQIDLATACPKIAHSNFVAFFMEVFFGQILSNFTKFNGIHVFFKSKMNHFAIGRSRRFHDRLAHRRVRMDGF